MKQKKILLKIVIPIIVISCTAVFIPWDLLWLWAKPLPKTIQEQVEDTTSHGLDGIIVYIEKKGEKPKFYSAGLQSRADQTPINPQALFKIASISKLYIAVAAAKLINNKSLSLDKTLATYLQEELKMLIRLPYECYYNIEVAFQILLIRLTYRGLTYR
jgi:D-alanyl-D-alanine carboxypeptidase